MKTKEEILDNKFKERGIRKGWIVESRQAVLDAMEEYADEKLRLYHIRISLVDAKFMKWLAKEAPELCESLYGCMHEYETNKR